MRDGKLFVGPLHLPVEEIRLNEMKSLDVVRGCYMIYKYYKVMKSNIVNYTCYHIFVTECIFGIEIQNSNFRRLFFYLPFIRLWYLVRIHYYLNTTNLVSYQNNCFVY